MMRQVLNRLLAHIDQGGQAAVCQLIETRGSTPQKAGALMLVFPDGSQAGTLGGGCVENEVKHLALKQLRDGQSVIDRFELDYDDAWHNGLICGGRMHVHVDPVSSAIDVGYYRQLLELVVAARGLTQAVVLNPAATGLAAGSRFLFDPDGRLAALRTSSPVGDLAWLAEQLVPVGQRPRPYVESGVCFLPILPRCRLVIVGGGHVGQAVAELAARVDFAVWVLDDREEFVTVERFPEAELRRAGPIDDLLRDVEITPESYVLIVTRGHHHDQRAVHHLVDRGAAYVGLIGSRRKIRMICNDLARDGLSPQSLAELFAPVGIDIGSQTVPEIAISIVAELVAHRNLQGVVPGRPARAWQNGEPHA